LSATTAPSAAAGRARVLRALLAHQSVRVGGIILVLIAAMGLLAPWLAPVDPTYLDPVSRNKLPGFASTIYLDDGSTKEVTHWLGTDQLGRDLLSRVLYGARVSLVVGLTVAAIAVAAGLVIGLVAGYIRWLDGIVMRVMDGLMAIPSILLALALVALWGAGLGTVIIAVAIPEVPRVVRLVRSIVLSVREEPYVEAAISLGTPTPLIMTRHILPNTIAPLIVQGTYVCASAILVEAILSFLGVGIPTEIPTWGNIMAEGRLLFRVYPHAIAFPGILLALTVLAVNMVGDGMRDTLDPKLQKRF
jgi:peptide/nickel transport system permease protein